MDKIKLSIIIVNWNTKELLRQCLNSLTQNLNLKTRAAGIAFGDARQNQNSKLKTEYEIIVVDNGSTDGSVETVKDCVSKNSRQFAKMRDDSCEIKLIENKENLGFAKANNIGIKQAKGDYIMLLNSDTIVKPDAIEQLLTFLSDRKEISIVGPRLLNADGTLQANCGRFPDLWVSFLMLFKEHFGGSETVRFAPKDSREVEWIMGAAFMAKKEVFDKIGGLDERIFMYMEEVEWFYRARKAGFKAFFCKDAEIIHLGRGSSVSEKKEPIINIYKGLLHFYKVHKGPLQLTILKFMLKLKAFTSFLIGMLKNDQYLKETYGQAIKIN